VIRSTKSYIGSQVGISSSLYIQVPVSAEHWFVVIEDERAKPSMHTYETGMPGRNWMNVVGSKLSNHLHDRQFNL